MANSLEVKGDVFWDLPPWISYIAGADLGFAHFDERDRMKLIKQGYRGSRYSFGYPACPNLADQQSLLDLLNASKIGIELGEEDQLWPEQSTSAIVLHHPQARYFNV